jgi:hypothetical protein
VTTTQAALLETIGRALPTTHRWEPRLLSAGCNFAGCDMPLEEHEWISPPTWDTIVAAREALNELERTLS